MWKDSIDTLLYKVAYKKEGLSTKLFSESAQTLVKEGTQAGIKELTQLGAKELGQTTLKEGSQVLLKEGTQGASKELGQKLFSEGSQTLTKEGSQKLQKELTGSLSKELGQQTSKQIGQTGAMTTAKKAGIAGLAVGSLIALDNIQTTDTNGDGVIDDKDKSLLDKGVSTVAGATGEVLGKVAGGAAGALGGVGSSILEGLGIDPEVVKDYAVKAFWIIVILIVVRILAFVYTGMKAAKKITGSRESKKKINLYSSVVKKV